MSATWTNQGLDLVNQYILGVTSSALAMKLRLIGTNYTPAVTDTWTGVSGNEMTNVGYAAQALTGGSWSGSTSGGNSIYTYPNVNFGPTANTPSGICYGYMLTVTISGTTTLLCAQLFSSSVTIPTGGLTIPVALTEGFQKY